MIAVNHEVYFVGHRAQVAKSLLPAERKRDMLEIVHRQTDERQRLPRTRAPFGFLLQHVDKGAIGEQAGLGINPTLLPNLPAQAANP